MTTIKNLNDITRQVLGLKCKLMQTQGITELPEDEQEEIREKVRLYNDFTEDNDPHGEHDFGSFEHNGKKIFWKIDYYDNNQ